MIMMTHVVCVPFTAQGHITPMLHLAKLLHNKGFYITFVLNPFNYKRLLKHGGLNTLPNGDSYTFCFETIPDGLTAPENLEASQDAIEMCLSTSINCPVPFRELVAKLNNLPDVPPVTCIVSDANMTFTLEVSQELGIPNVWFWTTNAFTLMTYLHYSRIRDFASQLHGKDMVNSEDKNIDWLPGIGSISLRDTPSMIWEPALPDIFVKYCITEIAKTFQASAVILNTFDALESEMVNKISALLNVQVYSIGPIHNLIKSFDPDDDHMKSIQSNLRKPDSGCIEWLDSKEAGSVIYVNFGSTTFMSPQLLEEFAWGLGNSMQNFLWIIRADLIVGGSPFILPPEFVTMTEGRGLVVSWCDQQQLLSHLSIGGFLTHCGWNSTLESLSAGLPMICWPFFADQLSVRHCVCKIWGVGIEMDGNVSRGGVEKVVRELMEEEKGKEIKKMALEWKRKSEMAIAGLSQLNFDKLVNEVILSNSGK